MENGIDQIAELNKNPHEQETQPRTNNKKVAYYYDHDVGNFNYGLGHPMKPHRMRMTHNLLTNYGVLDDMDVFRPTRSTHEQLTRFHTDEYIDFLQRVTPETVEDLTGSGSRFLVGDDCPAFEGVYEFCTISAGGSISAAQRLNSGAADTCVNWAGGLHHAKKREASGFCYVNDIVLAVLELLRFHPRVLYIDIDVHHGDGVEEAFYSTDRVMTCSFHKFGDFFPGTGDVRDVGIARGKNYAVNIPLRDGITDEAYKSIFEPVIQRIMDWFRPGAVILQCGADSLAGDKLGMFNLSMKGHADCVKFLNSFGVPLMLLGGGGYTTKNVARTWTYETGVVLGKELDENLPYNDYLEYFGPRFKLEVMSSNMENQNTKEYLDNIKTRVFEALRSMPFAPSAGMQEVPKSSVGKELGFIADDDDSGNESDIDRQINQRIRHIHDAQSRSKAGSWRDNGDSDSDSRMDTDDEDGRSHRSRPSRPHHQPSKASSSHGHSHGHGQHQQPVASSSRHYPPGASFNDALASNFSARRHGPIIVPRAHTVNGRTYPPIPDVAGTFNPGSGLVAGREDVRRRKRSFFAHLDSIGAGAGIPDHERDSYGMGPADMGGMESGSEASASTAGRGGTTAAAAAGGPPPITAGNGGWSSSY